MDCPLHSSQLSLSEGHELEGQVITVPTGIEAPTLLTEIVVGLKLVPSAATQKKEQEQSFHDVLPSCLHVAGRASAWQSQSLR